MPLYRHPGMTVLRFFPQAALFLKQYTTHTAEASRAAFLTREGKTVAVQRQTKISEDEVWGVVGTTFVPRLKTHLAKYLALSETQMTVLDGVSVYFDEMGDGPAPDGADRVIPEKAGRWLLSTDSSKCAPVSDAAYRQGRVLHAIPEQGIDYDEELPLCVDPDLVSFDKGCYLGQEIVARVHYRGAPPKKLEIRSRRECSPQDWARATSVVGEGADARGFLFVPVLK